MKMDWLGKHLPCSRDVIFRFRPLHICSLLWLVILCQLSKQLRQKGRKRALKAALISLQVICCLFVPWSHFHHARNCPEWVKWVMKCVCLLLNLRALVLFSCLFFFKESSPQMFVISLGGFHKSGAWKRQLFQNKPLVSFLLQLFCCCFGEGDYISKDSIYHIWSILWFLKFEHSASTRGWPNAFPLVIIRHVASVQMTCAFNDLFPSSLKWALSDFWIFLLLNETV